MPADPHPRYVCLHHPVVRGLHSEPAASFVLDTWYCYAHVARFEGSPWVYFPADKTQRRVSARTRAEEAAAKLNAEHDAWLTQVDVTPATRKDASR